VRGVQGKAGGGRCSVTCRHMPQKEESPNASCLPSVRQERWNRI